MENVALLIVWIAFALICYALAKKKGKNEIIAIAMGLLFGLFAVIYYILTKGSKEYQVQKAKETVKKLSD